MAFLLNKKSIIFMFLNRKWHKLHHFLMSFGYHFQVLGTLSFMIVSWAFVFPKEPGFYKHIKKFN